MRILYSFNKAEYEGDCWHREIAAASDGETTFVPFNHQRFLDPLLYSDATKLDALYRVSDVRLMRMYEELRRVIAEQRIDAMIVANCPPYHPEFLRTLPVYRALYSADDPGATYLINIPYLHAYHHVFFVAPSYSRDLSMREKMQYAGMQNADWLPISVFDFEHDADATADIVHSRSRDIDVIYIGGFWRQKVNRLVALRRAIGNQFRIYGTFRAKHNLYLNARFGTRTWVRPVTHQERVRLYQRAKIGINIHYNEFGLGNQRLFHLPANGVMQISDCEPHLSTVFAPGREIAAYTSIDDLVDKVRHYLHADDERRTIARAGYERTMREYRFGDVTQRAADLIGAGMHRIAWGGGN